MTIDPKELKAAARHWANVAGKRPVSATERGLDEFRRIRDQEAAAAHEAAERRRGRAIARRVGRLGLVAIDALPAILAILGPALAVAAVRAEPSADVPRHQPLDVEDERARTVRRARRAEPAAIAAAQAEAFDHLAAAARVVADAAYAFNSDDPADLSDRDADVLASATELFGLALLPAASTRHSGLPHGHEQHPRHLRDRGGWAR